jgi:hypothetical protein
MLTAVLRSLFAGSLIVAGSAATAAGFDPVEPYEYAPDYLRGTLGYFHQDDDILGDFSAFYADLDAERQYGNILAFGGIGHLNGDGSDNTYLELGAGYYVTPSVLVGASVLAFDNDLNSGTDVSVFAQYEGSNSAIALSYNDPEFGDDYLILSGEYMFSDQTSVFGGWYHESGYNNLTVNLEHNAGATTYNLIVDVDDDDYKGALLYLEHQFNDRTRVFGGIGASSDTGFSGRIAAVGAGYKVADNLWLDGSIGRYDTNSNDGNVLAITLTYEVGKSKRVERRVFNSYRDIYEGIGYLDF